MNEAAAPAGQAEATWYLLQTKPRQGQRAEEHLQNQGYTCFRPLVTVERLQGGQRRQLEEPLFPGYLFIQLDSSQNWAPIRSTRGVSRFVAFNGQPAPVPAAIIETLRQRCASVAPQPVLQAGDSVRITGGAFADLEAVFHCFDGEQRAIILLDLLQRRQTVSIPVNQLQKT